MAGMDWFRWHHGAVTDPKFQLIARKSGASLPDVLAVWAYVLESASQSADRGAIGEIDAEALDCLFNFPNTETRTADILSALQDRVVRDGRVIAWEKRQPKRERDDDTSTSRVQAFRDKKRHETPSNASEDLETPRVEESRGDKKEEKKAPRVPRSSTPHLEGVSDELLSDYLKVRKAKKAGELTGTAIAGLQREAGKAGITLAQAVTACVEFGWQGFNAGWYAERVSGGRASSITVPGREGRDPALLKIEEDSKKAAPIPANILEKINALKGNGVNV